MGSMTGIDLIQPKQEHYDGICRVYKEAIGGAFAEMGLGDRIEDIRAEVAYKQSLIRKYLEGRLEGWQFLVAVSNNSVVGTISFGPCGNEIKALTDESFPAEGELGGLYVLPATQNIGIGSTLITVMLSLLAKEGIRRFALDSGYRQAQHRWVRKFGQPYLIAKDFWGEGSDHMVWLCQIGN